MRTIYNRLTLILFFVQFATLAQWSARTSIGPGNDRTFSTSFAVNGKIYVVGGQFNLTGRADVWEYDIIANTWAQKTSFPGGVRGGAVAFSIGNLAYFAGGTNYTGQFFKDVWEYDSLTDTWTQKNNAPFFIRSEAVGFAIGNRGYIGTGYFEMVVQGTTVQAALNDFWEYNPVNDSWTQKANFPGQARGWAIGVSQGGRGYVGLGSNPGQLISFMDFYEYDPVQNTWTTKSNYPQTLGDAGAFGLNGDVYVCGGVNYNLMTSTSFFRKYTPATDTWTTLAAFSGSAIGSPVSGVVSNRAFLGTGSDLYLTPRDDWWEFVTSTTVTCPGPVTFNTSTITANGCTGKIILSSITNACSPYTVSILPNTGTITASANSATITGLCAGNYTVKVTDNNCCGSSQNNCTVPAAIATVLRDDGMQVFNLNIVPNPNHGNFILQVPANTRIQKSELTIMDVLGKQIDFSFEQVNNDLLVKLNGTAKGLFFLNCNHEQGVFVKKIIID